MPTGILEDGGGTPTIFPNPANEELNVSLNGAMLTRPDWVILDGRGRSVRSGSFGTVAQEPLQVPVASLSPGMYWLRSEVNGSIKRLPFVKR
ncbi:MAG: T9SS type A sorting domain-containing protein [Flavobacteriales bacterium]|nr:T9SS type A sorting domain-containing protein [Flavobacteriales bacterium]